MKYKFEYCGKSYSIAFDKEKKPCEKCCLRQECINDENDDFLGLCEPWMTEGSCYIKEENK